VFEVSSECRVLSGRVNVHASVSVSHLFSRSPTGEKSEKNM